VKAPFIKRTERAVPEQFKKRKDGRNMAKVIMGVQLEKRNSTATSVQDVLTGFGCFIQTRIGLHQTAGDSCSEKGLIILEMTDDAENEAARLEAELKSISGVSIQKMVF